jgi:hypothetical protein
MLGLALIITIFVSKTIALTLVLFSTVQASKAGVHKNPQIKSI